MGLSRGIINRRGSVREILFATLSIVECWMEFRGWEVEEDELWLCRVALNIVGAELMDFCLWST